MNVRPVSNDGKAFGYAALTIVFWSTVASAFALTLRHVGPFELLFYSSLFAMLLLGVIVLLSPKNFAAGPAGTSGYPPCLGYSIRSCITCCCLKPMTGYRRRKPYR
jgi:hypothetical protein